MMTLIKKAPSGFEPETSGLLDQRSNQLSYGAFWFTSRQDSLHFIFRVAMDRTLYSVLLEFSKTNVHLSYIIMFALLYHL